MRGRLPFQTTNRIRRLGSTQTLDDIGQSHNSNLACLVRTMIPQPPLQDGSRIQDLPDDHAPGDFRALRRVVRRLHLRDAQEDIPAPAAIDRRQGASALREEADMHASLRAESQQERAHEDISEADERLERVDREPHHDLLLALGDDRLTLTVKVDALRGHIQRVQQLPHVAAPSSCRSSHIRAERFRTFG